MIILKDYDIYDCRWGSSYFSTGARGMVTVMRGARMGAMVTAMGAKAVSSCR